MKVYPVIADSEEQGAVVSARTSRSPDTFDVILNEVRAKGHEKFIKDNVLGYGHDSVAEVAQCPIIGIEDISDIAANVIATADPQLVVQMTSTRFQDMNKRKTFDMHGHESMRGDEMKRHYQQGMVEVQKILDATDHPRKRTLQCDIARAFLPAGVSTQLAIRANARVMRDTVSFCQGHELSEVRLAGDMIQQATKAHVEVLFDRHITPAPKNFLGGPYLVGFDGMKPGQAKLDGELWRYLDDEVRAELICWRDSGWRRRMRIAACPRGPWITAHVMSDWGAYRDLRRNRTLAQDDVLPSANDVPIDAMWAFRDLYPDVCETVDKLTGWRCVHDDFTSDDPYVAPMGSLVRWRMGGHLLNWAYALRIRSAPTCHPAYSLPMRWIMRQLLGSADWIADAMGVVDSPKSLLGVEFIDRVPK